MSKVDQIKAYNSNLVETLTKIDINEYFKYIHDKFYSNQDISFMSYFLDLINSDDQFCVEYIKLQEYKVINIDNDSSKILRCLNQYNLIEGEDYLLDNVVEQLPSGTKYSKQYKLTPDAFKICLMRAKNSLKYATYYLLHEKNYKHYTDYRKLYDEKLLSMKDDKIDQLIKENKEQSKEIRKILGYTKDIKKQNTRLTTKVDNIRDTLEEMVEDVVVKTDNKGKLHEITIIKKVLDDIHCQEYLVIRTQKTSHSNRIRDVMQELYEQDDGESRVDYNRRIRHLRARHILMNFDYNGNSILLYNKVKETLYDIFEDSDCIEYTNQTKTGFYIIKERKFIRMLETNDTNEVLSEVKQNLVDNDEILTIDNFLTELLKVTENMKRLVSE
jgi:hypothetical protein